uniref:Uncharacterized protein n=1 Tax=Castor canadensis TaxID=51338 RepID=A0A8C0XSC3_CASCN
IHAIGTGLDLPASTFSPKGRVGQVEHVTKTMKNIIGTVPLLVSGKLQRQK